jgi:hypothetical protein
MLQKPWHGIGLAAGGLEPSNRPLPRALDPPTSESRRAPTCNNRVTGFPQVPCVIASQERVLH